MKKRITSGFLAFTMIISMISYIPPRETFAAMNDDLVAWYTFDDVEGTTVQDQSGSNNNASLEDNAAIGDGVEGTGLELDGAGAHVKLPNGILNGLDAVTISTYVNVKEKVGYQRIFNFAKDDSKYLYLLLSGGNSNAEGLAAGITKGGWSQEQTIASPEGTDLEPGAWRHVALVFDESTTSSTIYLDGEKFAENTDVKVSLSELQDTVLNYIGKSTLSWDSGGSNIKVDDFRIYNRALTASEIEDIATQYNIPTLSNDATLSDLKVGGATIPNFSPSTYDYTLQLPAGTAPEDEIAQVTAIKNDEKASGPVIDQPKVLPGNATVSVRAENGITKTYTIHLTLEESVNTDALLSDLKVNGKTVEDFSPTQYEYTVKVPDGTKAGDAVTTVVGTADAACKANIEKVTPASVIPGSASILVTSEDGNTKQMYIVHFATSDMLAWYTFDNKNGQTIFDASGNGKNATLKEGTSLVTGQVNNAVALDGATGYVQLPESIVSGLEEVSVATWVYVKETVSYQRIFDFGESTSKYMYLLSSGRNNGAYGLAAAITTGGWSKEQVAQKGTDLATGSWKHVTAVFSKGAITLYENGLKVAENTNVTVKPSELGTSYANNWIGKSQYGDLPFNGMIDDFRIYNRALSGSEVAAMMNLSDEQIVANDTATLSLGESLEVTGDLTLPSAGSLGSIITWESKNPQVITNDGKVTLPDAGKPDIKVQLVATITKGSETATKTFELTVKAKLTDNEIVDKDMQSIYLGNLRTVDSDLTMPSKGKAGSVITWESSHSDIISIIGKVTRPEAGQGDAKVILTAVVTYGSVSKEIEFEATVIQKEKVLKIESVQPIKVETTIGTSPELPSVVTVVRDDHSTGMAAVVWDDIDSQKYAQEGMFAIEGTVQNTEIKAVAHIRVNALDVKTTFNMNQLESDKILTSTVHATNYTTQEIYALAIVTLYNEELTMEKVEYTSKLIGAGKTEDFSKDISLPYDVSGHKVKVFVWQGTDLNDTTMKPLAKVTEITSEASGINSEWVAKPFSLESVSLQASPFTENRDRTNAYLLSLDDDRMLYNFRATAGLDTKGAEPLGGWDAPDCKLRGHSTGHYLSALAQAYASSKAGSAEKEQFKQKIDYMITELGKCQEALPTQSNDMTDATAGNNSEGYLAGYPEKQFIRLEQLANYGSGPDDIWAPYYTNHKIMAGLLDCYQIAANEQALDIVTKMGDWVYGRLSKLTPKLRNQMWSKYIAGEYGGMNEVLAKLYAVTSNERYLTTSKYFDNDKLFIPMANDTDTLSGMHANQHIPQIIGALQEFDQTQDVYYYNVADNFWDMVTEAHMFNIGGSGDGEMFKEPYQIAKYIGDHNAETCFTYNMLKLSKDLFFHNPDPKYMDYYERALYNHILASQNQGDPHGGVTYFVPLGPGQSKSYTDDYNSFTCCHGTGMENHTKYQESIYFKSADESALYVNLYIPSTLNWEEQGFTIIQTGDYLKDQKSSITVNGDGKLDIKLRVPFWIQNGFSVKINGEAQTINAAPGSYITLSRTWESGDKIDIEMPFSFRLERTPDDTNIASIMYGPLVMVANDSSNSYIEISSDFAELIEETGDALTFNVSGTTLVPMYTVYDSPYHAYFKIK